MSYVPNIISIHDYFLAPHVSYDWDESISEDAITDPYVIPDERRSEICGNAPIAKAKMIRTNDGKVKISYYDFRLSRQFFYKSHVDIDEPVDYIKLQRELIVVNPDLKPKQILLRIKRIFDEICLRQDLHIRPNPDCDVLVHTIQGMFHALVIY